MINNSIYVKMTDPDFSLVSMAEYSERAAQRYQDVQALIVEAMNADEPYSEEVAYAKMATFGFVSDARIPVGPNRVALSDYLVQISAQAADEDDDSDPLSTTFEATPNQTLADFGDQLNADLHSVVSFAAACRAQASKAADKVSYFYSSLAQKFASAYSDLSNTSEAYASLLSASVPDNQFIATAAKLLNVETYAQSEEPDPYNSDIAGLTGASPLGPLDFSSACQVANAALNAGARIVGGLFNALADGIAWAASSATRYVTQTVVNPDDLESTEVSGASPTIDKFCWQWQNVRRTYNYDAANVPQLFRDLGELLQSTGQKYYEKWIKWDFVFGEVLLMIHEFKAYYWNDYQSYSVDMTFDAQFKPKVMNPAAVEAAIQATGSGYDWNKFLSYLTTQEYYLLKSNDESQKALGLMYAIQMMERGGVAGGEQILGFRSYTYGVPYKISVPEGTVWTNRNFAYLAAGHLKDSYSGNELWLPTGVNLQEHIMVDALYYMCLSWLASKADETKNPLDATWIPYTNNTTAFNPSAWRIKTDEQNAAACANFITAVLITVVVVALAVVTGVVVAKVSKALFFKRKTIQSTLQAKMNSGAKLTNKEMRQYVKATRKLNASNYLTAATKKGPQSSEQNTDVDTVYAAIVGTPSD